MGPWFSQCWRTGLHSVALRAGPHENRRGAQRKEWTVAQSKLERGTRQHTRPPVVSQPVDHCPGRMIPPVRIRVFHISPTSILVLDRQQVFEAGPDEVIFE